MRNKRLWIGIALSVLVMVIGCGIIAGAVNASAQDTASSQIQSADTGEMPVQKAPEGFQIIQMDQLDGLTEEASQRGTVTRFRYNSLNEDGIDRKVVYIYLPYGYEESNDCYNVIYLLHGANSSPTNYLDIHEVTEFQNMLDYMVENKLLDPVIVAMPTYYTDLETQAQLSLTEQVKLVEAFPGELAQEIIPAVEGRYRTYAASTDEQDLIAARDHRAVGGFSMGGVATWYVMLQEMNLFRYYMPLSEASWDDGEGGTKGIYNSFLSADVIHQAIIEQGYSADDLVLFAATGTRDSAMMVTSLQMEALSYYKDTFRYGENTFYYIAVGGKHLLKDAKKYICMGLQKMFG